jgi:hypothetical protein
MGANGNMQQGGGLIDQTISPGEVLLRVGEQNWVIAQGETKTLPHLSENYEPNGYGLFDMAGKYR